MRTLLALVGVTMATSAPVALAQSQTGELFRSDGTNVFMRCSAIAGTQFNCFRLQGAPPPTDQQKAGGNLGNVIGGAASSGSAFKAYQFSNVGTLPQLQSEMRAVGLTENFIQANSAGLLKALRANPTKAGLAMVVIGGASYSIYHLWKGDKK